MDTFGTQLLAQEVSNAVERGITNALPIRDMLAMAAMIEIGASSVNDAKHGPMSNWRVGNGLAKECYEWADEMMKAREVKSA